MNEKQLQALVKRNAAKAAKIAEKRGAYTDPTLKATKSPDRDDSDAQKIFKEMKRREF